MQDHLVYRSTYIVELYGLTGYKKNASEAFTDKLSLHNWHTEAADSNPMMCSSYDL